LFNRLKYIDRITALTDCSIITVKKSNVIEFLSQKKEIFLKIVKDYSNKLRELDSLYNKVIMGNSIVSSYDSILLAKKFLNKME
jgi:CRP-like cAMP-binding protein